MIDLTIYLLFFLAVTILLFLIHSRRKETGFLLLALSCAIHLLGTLPACLYSYSVIAKSYWHWQDFHPEQYLKWAAAIVQLSVWLSAPMLIIGLILLLRKRP
jgi:hypothetical protein